MIDLTTTMAPELASAMLAVRELEVNKKMWNRRLREMKASDRRRALRKPLGAEAAPKATRS